MGFYEIRQEGYLDGVEEERDRLRPLLERCVDLAEGLAFNRPEDKAGSEATLALLADLRHELERAQ